MTNPTLDEKSEAALREYVKRINGLFPGPGSTYEHGWQDGYETALGDLQKAAENLSHAVSACNYAQDTYLYEAAVELLQRLKAVKSE